MDLWNDPYPHIWSYGHIPICPIWAILLLLRVLPVWTGNPLFGHVQHGIENDACAHSAMSYCPIMAPKGPKGV